MDPSKLKCTPASTPDFKLKNVTLQNFKDKKAALETAQSDLIKKELELAPLRNDRDQLSAELKDICVRVRAGIKGYFGSDSTEYEQAGGTRKSERKKPSRKNATATVGK